MRQFLILLIKFSLPLFIIGALITGTYFYYDPFKVVRDYPDYYCSVVGLNEDYIATERYLKSRTHEHYNSFILGSSRAGSGFDVHHWQMKLGKDAHAFSYAASNESLFGMYGKLRLIDEKGDSIKNVLLVICSDVTFSTTKNSTGHLFIKHPLVSNESEKYFQEVNLKGYIFTGFFIPYLDYKIFKTQRPYMVDFLKFKLTSDTVIYPPFLASYKESVIRKNEFDYYKNTPFYKRTEIVPPYHKQIFSAEQVLLKNIYNLFQKHHTNYKIIISPLYNQQPINNEDLNALYHIFGKDRVFDFSGKNSITDNKLNYYEFSHYRFHVGDSILNRIYTSTDSTVHTVENF
ncbi:MAG: hypothetical protein JWO58_2211 [Chitinophagaceae bacterium]|nr:hypothetical protein [Chitinophagaceae bacterium]